MLALYSATRFQDQQEAPRRPRCSGPDPTVGTYVETCSKHLWDNPEKAIRALVPRNVALLIKAAKRSNLTTRIAHISLLSSINRLTAYVTACPFKRAEEGVFVADLLRFDIWAVVVEIRRPAAGLLPPT